MSDWREFAKRGAWSRIMLHDLDDADKKELLSKLEQVVPLTTRGHGIETYEGYIRPKDAASEEIFFAALLLEELQRYSETGNDDGTGSISEAVSHAVKTLTKCGVNYEGWTSTFFYWDPNLDAWVQLSNADGKSIEAERNAILDIMSKSSLDETMEWHRELNLKQKPWRSCRRLNQLFRTDFVEHFTPLWHAFNILCHNESLVNIKDYHADWVDEISACAFEIGRSYEALLKKPMETHALRGIGTLNASRQGAAARQRVFESHTTKIVETMDRLLSERPGISVSWAAKIAFQRGVGTSPGANRAAWYRSSRR